MLRLAFAGPFAAHLEPVRGLHQCDLARGGGPVGFAWGAGAQAAQWHSRVGPATRPLC
jgi:hypothetical protein